MHYSPPLHYFSALLHVLLPAVFTESLYVMYESVISGPTCKDVFCNNNNIYFRPGNARFHAFAARSVQENGLWEVLMVDIK